MKWFGEVPWGPVCEPGGQVPRPTGQRCFDCGELVLETDCGYMMPFLTDKVFEVKPGEVVSGVEAAAHRECIFLGIMGSAKHLSGLCPCGQKAVIHAELPPFFVNRRAEALWVWYQIVDKPQGVH